MQRQDQTIVISFQFWSKEIREIYRRRYRRDPAPMPRSCFIGNPAPFHSWGIRGLSGSGENGFLKKMGPVCECRITGVWLESQVASHSALGTHPFLLVSYLRTVLRASGSPIFLLGITSKTVCSCLPNRLQVSGPVFQFLLICELKSTHRKRTLRVQGLKDLSAALSNSYPGQRPFMLVHR